MFAVAFALGALVGAAELLKRYNSDPFNAVFNRWGLSFVLVNGVVSAVALGAMDYFDVLEPATGAAGGALWYQRPFSRVVWAGLGGLTLLRTKFGLPGTGSQIDLSHILDSLLGALDSQLGRNQTASAIEQVGRAVHGLAFDQVAESLPLLCLSSPNVQVSDDAKRELGTNAKEWLDSGMPADHKTLLLGVRLYSLVGIDVLRAAAVACGGGTDDSGGPAMPWYRRRKRRADAPKRA